LPVTTADSGVLFRDAEPGRSLVFPQDHGKHPDFQTEWWYFTGNLDSGSGKWGFHLTFFRRSFVQSRAEGASAWRVRDLYPGHLALTDVTNRKFFHGELLSREGPGLAGASEEDLSVRIKDWSAVRRENDILLRARQGDYALDLRLVPVKPVVLHGAGGYSRKGDAGGQASHYYSFSRMQVHGSIRFAGASHDVTGLAWMDHEFGSSILSEDQAGWDWFSLQLDDGSEIMVFHLRKKDGSFEQPFGTLITREGSAVDLADKNTTVSHNRTWASPRTGAVYPAEWSIVIPDSEISILVKPLVEDQELAATRSTRTIYWEGAVGVSGTVKGKAVEGRGYVELTGYAHSMAGRL